MPGFTAKEIWLQVREITSNPYRWDYRMSDDRWYWTNDESVAGAMPEVGGRLCRIEWQKTIDPGKRKLVKVIEVGGE
jgi:hypothetical protein